jgi:glucoamylase
LAGHVRDKHSKLDIVVIMAANIYDRFLPARGPLAGDSPVLNPWTIATAGHIKKTFEQAYKINQNGDVGALVGRYPEDRYFGGNPWPVTTMALAEYFYRLVGVAREVGEVEVTEANMNFINAALSRAGHQHLKKSQKILRGDGFFEAALQGIEKFGEDIFRRIRKHVGDNGEMAEQFHRDIGYLTALPHLTWSYSAFIDAALARKRVTAPECAQLLHEHKFVSSRK